MFGLLRGMHYCRGIVGDGRVGWWACRDREGFILLLHVGGNWLDEPDEVVDDQCGIVDGLLHVGNVEKKGVQDVMECREIVITWLSNNGLEGSSSHGKCCGDFLGHHGGKRIGMRYTLPWYWMRW